MSFWFKLSLHIFIPLIYPRNKIKRIGKNKCTNTHSCEHLKSGVFTVKMSQKQEEKSVTLIRSLHKNKVFCSPGIFALILVS